MSYPLRHPADSMSSRFPMRNVTLEAAAAFSHVALSAHTVGNEAKSELARRNDRSVLLGHHHPSSQPRRTEPVTTELPTTKSSRRAFEKDVEND